MMERLKNFVGGQWRDIASEKSLAVLNPAQGERIAQVPISGGPEISAAVAAATSAFGAWRATPVAKRCRILMRCKQVFEARFDDLARSVVRENGKTLSEAAGEVRRGIEVVEFASGMPSLSKGDYIENISAKIDGFIYREPLGVVIGACPFNFPAMIPLWMIPIAVACGNTFILKPSEKCPMTAGLIADIFKEGGLPDGTLNVVQGDGGTFQTLIADPGVRAVSFVGSTPAAESVWRSATGTGKRCQALGGAKNCLMVMPDADQEETIGAILGSSFGCAGERCMATSLLLLVGSAAKLLPRIVEAAQALRVGDGLDAATDMGPLVNAEHKTRVDGYIEKGIREGAEVLLDGRCMEAPDGCRGGFFTGPTILDRVTPKMTVAREEIFGPVLCVMHADSLNGAMELVESVPYGNGASIFTRSGAAARAFRERIECGMIGINAGVPAPMAFFSFGGRKRSFFGDLRAHGPDGVEFYTRKKAVIERWFGDSPSGDIWAK